MSCLKDYQLVEDSTLPYENTMAGPFHADSLEQCVELCARHNATLAGSLGADGAIGTGYSWQHCNAFVFDREQRRCTLKNKRMGNFYPQEGAPHPRCATPAQSKPGRYVAGYTWESAINEINTPYPNMTSGMQYCPLGGANPTWSTDNWGVTNNHCSGDALTGGQWPKSQCIHGYCPERVLIGRGVGLKPVGYDVRPGAIISPKNVTTGPFSIPPLSPQSGVPAVETRRVRDMQQCADLAAQRTNLPGLGGAYAGVNAWTFYPDYTAKEATDDIMGLQQDRWAGTCALAHVREPYYQTLTPAENGAISGFALNSLSRQVQNFLFGSM